MKDQVSKAYFKINDPKNQAKRLLTVLAQKLSGKGGFQIADAIGQILLNENVDIIKPDNKDLKDRYLIILSEKRKNVDPDQRRLLETKTALDLANLIVSALTKEK